MSLSSTRIAVYPGTFDPVTNGHVDLVDRAAPLFERLVVGVAESPGKKPALPMTLRVELAREALAGHDNVEVRGFNGLLAHFVRDLGAGVLLRGLRVADQAAFRAVFLFRTVTFWFPVLPGWISFQLMQRKNYI